jgi:hypothetical protein
VCFALISLHFCVALFTLGTTSCAHNLFELRETLACSPNNEIHFIAHSLRLLETKNKRLDGDERR